MCNSDTQNWFPFCLLCFAWKVVRTGLAGACMSAFRNQQKVGAVPCRLRRSHCYNRLPPSLMAHGLAPCSLPCFSGYWCNFSLWLFKTFHDLTSNASHPSTGWVCYSSWLLLVLLFPHWEMFTPSPMLELYSLVPSSVSLSWLLSYSAYLPPLKIKRWN